MRILSDYVICSLVTCVSFTEEAIYSLISRPGRSQGLLINTFVIHQFINSFINPLVKISVRRRHAQTVKNGAFSDQTNYIDIFSEILNVEGHLNHCIGSKVKAILLNGWILPTSGVASRRVC